MAKNGDAQAIKLVVERILPVMKAFEEPKQVAHSIEVTLKTPAWLQSPECQTDIKTIEHQQHLSLSYVASITQRGQATVGVSAESQPESLVTPAASYLPRDGNVDARGQFL